MNEIELINKIKEYILLHHSQPIPFNTYVVLEWIEEYENKKSALS